MESRMLLRWPQNHIEPQHLNHWISSSIQDETFLQETINLLDEWNEIWISQEECNHLKTLLARGEVDLVYRYLDLQLSYRMAKDKDILHDSLELEKQLDLYLSNPAKSHFLLEVGIRCIQHTLYSWFQNLNIESPSEFKNLKEADLSKKIQRILKNILKEQSFSLDVKDKLFLEDFLNQLIKSDDDIEYLNQFCSCIEQLDLWEKTLKDILCNIEEQQNILSSLVTDPSSLSLQLDYFEGELLNFHKYLGKSLTSLISTILTDTQRAITIGKFRGYFQSINNAYGKLKSKILGKEIDLHLCCMCHYAENIQEFWPINNQIINVPGKMESRIKSQSEESLLIFTCGGGKGHLSTASAMAEYAESKYHILAASTLEETLASSDVLRKMLLDLSQEKLYNRLLKNEEFEWLKLIISIGPFFILMQQENIERLIRLEILRQNPQMIISCVTIMNSMILNVAKELNLPVLFVTTDLDTAYFTKGMEQKTCDLTYPRYRMTLAYENPEMRAIMEKNIPKDKIHVSGFPIRCAFNREISEEIDEQTRKKFKIQNNEQLILVMMGGNAGLATERYAAILSSLNEEDIEQINEGKRNLHILCLCGDQNVIENQEMRIRINHLHPKCKKIRIQGIPATDQIAELMNIADVLITKPGGCATNEALTKKLPMIFHAPFALMSWEVFNMKFCIKLNMGARFRMSNVKSLFKNGLQKNKKRLVPLLKKALERRSQLKQDPLLFKGKDFKQEFLYLVNTLLNKL